MIRNSLQPTMHIQVENAPGNGSIISTRYTTSIFVKVFLIVWMSIVIVATAAIAFGSLDLEPKARLFARCSAVCLPMFGVLLVLLMRLVALGDEKKLEGLVKDVVATAEAEQPGQKNKY